MVRKLSLFKTNTTNIVSNTIQLTPELCQINAAKGIETTIHVDLNVISAIRKFTFCEKTLDSGICALIEEIITTLRNLSNIYISPGFALYESNQEYIKKNLEGFELFLKQHLPKYHDAYNAIEYSDCNDLWAKSYIINAQAALYTIHYVNYKFSSSNKLQKFTKFLDIIHGNLAVVDPIVCEIAKYGFLNPDDQPPEMKKIVTNFIKKGNKSKSTLNAAYDLCFFQVARILHNQQMKNYNGKVDSWCMTADNGIACLFNYISFPHSQSPHIYIHNAGLDKISDYLTACDSYFKQISQIRSESPEIQRGITDIDNGVYKAKQLINKLDREIR